MTIQETVKAALSDTSGKNESFRRQIEQNKEFKRRMNEAGVIPNKQKFSIPLIERIGTLYFSK